MCYFRIGKVCNDMGINAFLRRFIKPRYYIFVFLSGFIVIYNIYKLESSDFQVNVQDFQVARNVSRSTARKLSFESRTDDFRDRLDNRTIYSTAGSARQLRLNSNYFPSKYNETERHNEFPSDMTIHVYEIENSAHSNNKRTNETFKRIAKDLPPFKEIHSETRNGVHQNSGLVLPVGVGNNEYHGIDLMTLPTYNFDPTYKNPCWKENGSRDILRCLPYFFIIGVKKCGTSELWRHISMHPEFAFPGFGKEAQWFARGRFNSMLYWWHRVPSKTYSHDSIEAYINLFERAALHIERRYKIGSKFQKQMITGDASPSNLHLNSHWRYLPGNENLDEPKYVILDYIHHFLPKAKIIIMFRDPVERLYSDYYHQFGKLLRNFSSSPQHFHKIVQSGLKLYKECFKRRSLRSCVYDERIYGAIKITIQLGIYHVYWQEITRLFPPEQILTIHTTELSDMERTKDKVFTFLSLRERSLPIGLLVIPLSNMGFLARLRRVFQTRKRVIERQVVENVNDERRSYDVLKYDGSGEMERHERMLG